MTEAMKGKTVAEAQEIFANFHNMVTSEGEEVDMEKLGKLAALAGVKEYPSRIKCATLCWHTLNSALTGNEDPVSTE